MKQFIYSDYDLCSIFQKFEDILSAEVDSRSAFLESEEFFECLNVLQRKEYSDTLRHLINMKQLVFAVNWEFAAHLPGAFADDLTHIDDEEVSE